MLNNDFLEKNLIIVSPPHFVFDFSRKMCHILYSNFNGVTTILLKTKNPIKDYIRQCYII